MIREKQAATVVLKSSNNIIKGIGKVYTKIIRIQPDETSNTLKVYNISLLGEIYFRLENIRADILGIR